MGKELFDVMVVPGCGKGLVARTYIPRGTRIISEAPLFSISNFAQTSLTDIVAYVTSILKKLPKDQQRGFLGLHNAFIRQASPFYGIVRTNSLPFGPESPELGLFLTCARLNHSCSPNANHSWNSDTRTESVHAIRDIDPGEEITICYQSSQSSHSNRASRQDELLKMFGFECHCMICVLPAEDSRESDQRRAEIEELDRIIGSGELLVRNAPRALGACRTIIEHLEDEGIQDMRVARAYYDAFQICVSNGDMARASVFARKHIEEVICCEGEDAPGLKERQAFVDKPETHRLAGVSNMWESKLSDRARSDHDDFEGWLWKRAVYV
ncbi:SET domain-containing protein [Morchella conica CCBAS932]|uniref:SET domain-containing protein n=1 Tax=Morchella conica CCBAS932 TaxID=1392247 RepID=A0A3N4KEZ3_9PEZI|nr:SET domain-containing protein [Morchella conica CCBAS932]